MMPQSLAKPALRRPAPPTLPRPRAAKFWPAVGFAALSGSRVNSGPAFISQFLSGQALSPGLAGSPLRFLAKPGVAKLLKVTAAGEMAADKLPNTPNRIVPNQLGARVASGALVGATWYKAQGGSALAGAAVGAATAVAVTFATYYLRKGISEQTHTPTALVGVGEDALVVAGGLALVKSQQKK